MRKILLLCVVFTIFVPCAAFASGDLGFSVSFFLSNLSDAEERVNGKNGFALPEFTRLADGSLVGDCGSCIVFFVNTVPNTKIVKNIAVSFDTNSDDSGKSKTEKFRAMCTAAIEAVKPQKSSMHTDMILTRLGMDGSMFDGHQRSISLAGINYIVKMHSNGIIMFALTKN